MVKKLVDSERNQRKMKDDVSELREKCYYLELEKKKLAKMVDKLKLKCKNNDTKEEKKTSTTVTATSNGITSNHGNDDQPFSMYCCCEKDELSEKPQRLQKCCSFKVGKDGIDCETSVFSSEMHSAKLNYLYEGDKNSNHDQLGQSKHDNLSSGASVSSSSPLNECGNAYSTANSVVVTDDGVHKLCISTTDGIRVKNIKDRKNKEHHSKYLLRKHDEKNGATIKDHNEINDQRNTTTGKTSRNLVQAYVGGSGDSGLSLEDSSSASPSGSNKASPHGEIKYDSSNIQQHSTKLPHSIATRPARSLRASSRQQKQNQVIENDEDEFILIPSLRREDDTSSTTLTSEGSITDDNEEKKLPNLETEKIAAFNEKSKVSESFRPRSQIRRIDDEEEDDEDNEPFDNENETPIYQHYYERNLMLEEATTNGAEQISIGSLKRQFYVTSDEVVTTAPSLPTKLRNNKKHRKSSSGSNDEGMVMDGDRFSSSGSNKSTRSRNTSSSSKSLKHVEDEFSSEFIENEQRTVSRKSIVSRNSIIFAESVESEEDNKNSDIEEEEQKHHFASSEISNEASFDRNINGNDSHVTKRDIVLSNNSIPMESHVSTRSQNSNTQSLINDSFLPYIPPKKSSSSPTYPSSSYSVKNEKNLRKESFISSMIEKEDEDKHTVNIPEVSNDFLMPIHKYNIFSILEIELYF